MLKEHFFIRIMLTIVLGIFYVLAFMNMAKRNSIETVPQKHTKLKVLGAFFALTGILIGILSVYLITQVHYPEEAIGPNDFSSHEIIRPSDKTMYWGYPTTTQNQSISFVSNVFLCFGLAAYFFLFKSSNTNWWKKVFKILFFILFSMFYFSATNLHYFDIYELINPGMFAIMAFFVLRNKQEGKVKEIPVIITDQEEDIKREKIVNEPDDSTYMPKAIPDYGTPSSINETDAQLPDMTSIEQDHITIDAEIEQEPCSEENIQEPMEEQKSEPEADTVINFCRYCGKKVDYNSNAKFCKHCGKQLY